MGSRNERIGDVGTRAQFLPFPSILHGQAKVLPVSPTVVYQGRCCRRKDRAFDGAAVGKSKAAFSDWQVGLP